MIWNRPYEQWVAGLDLEGAALRLRVSLRSTLESHAPTLEVMQTEAFHIEFADTLVRDSLKPVVRIY
jgi:hypothetical protein